MMNWKKTLALTLTAILTLLYITGYATGFSDTKGTSFQNKAELLSVLDIMESNSGEAFGVGDEVTRSEFAGIVSRAIGLNLVADSANEQVYIDVPPEHKSFFSINMLFKTGIMTGRSDASFLPDNIITYEEAVKTLVMATGYYSVAEAKGGYPSGYLMVGSQNGLLKGVKASSGAKMTKGDIANLVYNAIVMDTFDIEILSGDVSYGKRNGENLLSQVYNIYKTTGNVNAFGGSSLESVDGKMSSGCVLIDETTYYVGKTSVGDLLGTRIEFFYQKTQDDDIRTLIYIMENERLNNIITVEAKDILNATTTSQLVFYDENNKESKENIAATARYIYNGKLLPSVVKDDLMPEVGNVTLIDANLDGLYETVIIKEYKSYVVDSVLPIDGVIRTRFTNDALTFRINENDNEKAYFYKDGFETDIASLSQWTVISVLESKNVTGNPFVSVYVSQEKVTGKVTEVSTGIGSDNTVTLDTGVTYTLSDSYIARAEAKLNGCSYPKPGEESTFYLDIFGNIEAKYAASATNNNFGFLISANISQGIEKKVSLKVFTLKSTIEIFETSTKVIVNGIQKTGENIVSDLRNPTKPSEIKPQLITYNTTADGHISEYKTATDKTSDKNYIANEDEFVLSRKFESSGLHLYKQMSRKDTLAVGKNTIVIDIPSDLSKEKDYAIGRKFDLDDSVKPPIYLYNVTNGGVIGVMVAMSGGAADTNFNTPQIVERVTQSINEEGDAKTKIYFSGGSSVLCDLNEVIYDTPLDWGYANVKVSDLQEGDIIQYTLKNKEVNSLRILVRASNLGKLRIDKDDIVKNGNQLSKVISVSDDKKFMVVEYIASGVTKGETRQIAGGIRRYNSKTGKMETSAAADIQPGDTVFLNTFNLSTTMIVIYR